MFCFEMSFWCSAYNDMTKSSIYLRFWCGAPSTAVLLTSWDVSADFWIMMRLIWEGVRKPCLAIIPFLVCRKQKFGVKVKGESKKTAGFMFEVKVGSGHRYGSRGFRIGHSSLDVTVILKEVRKAIVGSHVLFGVKEGKVCSVSKEEGKNKGGFICKDEVGLCHRSCCALFRSETPSCVGKRPSRREGGHEVRVDSFQ